ncbi:unnamed protein product [Parnassius mnemosyne]|uniref:Uncharacterized protein n=1 Tax=Parnassius mnemosyne TaxID=213953 RepID=A0AAV1L2Z1_9NEOP
MNVSNSILSEDVGETRIYLLLLRLSTLMILVSLLTIHIRSMRMFRWEQSVSGGLIIAYCIAELGLTLCAGTSHCSGYALQAYLCGLGAALLAVNAAVIWQLWKRSNQITLVVAELLDAIGVPLKRQVIVKVTLSATAAAGLLVDLVLAPYFTKHPRSLTSL